MGPVCMKLFFLIPFLMLAEKTRFKASTLHPYRTQKPFCGAKALCLVRVILDLVARQFPGVWGRGVQHLHSPGGGSCSLFFTGHVLQTLVRERGDVAPTVFLHCFLFDTVHRYKVDTCLVSGTESARDLVALLAVSDGAFEVVVARVAADDGFLRDGQQAALHRRNLRETRHVALTIQILNGGNSENHQYFASLTR